MNHLVDPTINHIKIQFYRKLTVSDTNYTPTEALNGTIGLLQPPSTTPKTVSVAVCSLTRLQSLVGVRIML